MKILWIVNMVMPELANYLKINTSVSGTWMIDISNRLSNESEIELGIACVWGNEYKEIEFNKKKYFLLPGSGKNMLFYTKRYEKIWEKVYESFSPDIVHLHGTEYSHGLSFLRRYPRVKSVVSIQGIINRVKDVDLGGLSIGKALQYRTMRENIHFNGMLEIKLIHHINAKYEKEILARTSFANCVNFWDESIVKSINPDITCFRIDYNLRDEFYNAPKWNMDEIVKYTIFTNPGDTPLKGLHILLRALEIVKRNYPQVQLLVPGFISKSGRLQISNGYSKYISSLINELDLTENVIFLGKQTAHQMVENIRRANVIVVPSAIEGTSLVLREAMFLGAPSIASFRGGMADFISDKVDGYLYDYQEYPYLAYRIINLFENESLCREFSKHAIQKAEYAHDREKNPTDYVNMYKNIFNSN